MKVRVDSRDLQSTRVEVLYPALISSRSRPGPRAVSLDAWGRPPPGTPPPIGSGLGRPPPRIRHPPPADRPAVRRLRLQQLRTAPSPELKLRKRIVPTDKGPGHPSERRGPRGLHAHRDPRRENEPNLPGPHGIPDGRGETSPDLPVAGGHGRIILTPDPRSTGLAPFEQIVTVQPGADLLILVLRRRPVNDCSGAQSPITAPSRSKLLIRFETEIWPAPIAEREGRPRRAKHTIP